MTKNGTRARPGQPDGTLDQGQLSPAQQTPGSRGSPGSGQHITGVLRPPARAAGGWRFA